MNLSENIYRCRTAHNLSQGAMAEALDVSRQSISKWENGSAVPELDKLLKMCSLFNLTLDELVNGAPAEIAAAPIHTPQFPRFTPRIISGIIIMLFGMVFFLLSVFWGDHLTLGEEFGELLSISIVLVSVALLATYQWPIFAVCSVIYAIYTVICAGILRINDFTNDIFLLFTGFVILVWFIVLGLHENRKTAPKIEEK